MKSGWILLKFSGIVNALEGCPRRRLRRNIRNGVTNMVTFRETNALTIYTVACGAIGVMPRTETTHLLIKQAVSQLRTTATALAELKKEMLHLAESLPEFPVVQKMYGVGPTLGPQLIAEIGDV